MNSKIRINHLLSISCALRATCHALPPAKNGHTRKWTTDRTDHTRSQTTNRKPVCSPRSINKVACPHRNWDDSQHGIWTILMVGAFQSRREPRQARLSVNASSHLKLSLSVSLVRISKVAPCAWKLFGALNRVFGFQSGAVARSIHH
jgi:hypothetical protein